MSYTDDERALVRAIQSGLPVSRDPFGDVARRLGAPPERVIDRLNAWRRSGAVRRVAAVVDQRRIGFAGNVMVAWEVHADVLEATARRFASRDAVTHCYARETSPEWPYNLFTMIHAPDEPAARRLIDAMAAEADVRDHVALFTVREFKKTPPVYVAPGRPPTRRAYPVGLLLEDRLCVVVGGGAVAVGKAEGLLAAGARVRVVAPRLDASLVDAPVERVSHEYDPRHLEGAHLVIAATDCAEVNRAVARDARARACLVNVVDDPAHSDFVVPSVARRGPLTVAVATDGASPALARNLRRRIEAGLPERIDAFCEAVGRVRREVIESVADRACRRAILEFLAGDEAYARFEQGGEDALRECVDQLRRETRKGDEA